MTLPDLHRAIAEHTGTFLSERINKPQETKTVNFQHHIQPPAALDAPLPDCAGVAAVKDGFVVTSGQGRCRFYDCRQSELTATPLDLPSGLWDNHLHVM